MAKILTTKGSSAALEDILLTASKEVYLISFSYIISDAFLKTIKRATDKGIKVKLVYGKSIKPEEELKKITGVTILHLPNLHAKIFANETKCIVGSMNFSEASEINNTELGVLLSSTTDEAAYKKVIEHCEFIVSESIVQVSSPVRKFRRVTESNNNETNYEKKEFVDPSQNASNWKNANNNKVSGKFNPLGYCIRTGERIPLDHTRPLCYDAYNVWVNYSDYQYPENFDHFTGERSNGHTSMGAPILQKNWNKYLRAIES